MLNTQDELKKYFDKREEKRQACLWAVITSLQFTDMQSRQHSIRNAYPDTYGWALTQDVCGLATWLRMGSGIYWISGHAGSGKSTFMKLLGNSQQTYGLLTQWSGKQECLIVVNCYFWYSGSALQKSIEGLLRTILYQILKAYPQVVEILFPTRWADASSGARDLQTNWTLDELRIALQSVGETITKAIPGSSPRQFCIFIDGLDEYSGRHGDLVRSLTSLVTDKNIKLCVSSRPWNVFVNAFETQGRYIPLHDFTEGDIRHYVESSLGLRRPSSTTVSSTNDYMLSIANDIVRRAEGVFLWVYLVVESVTRGLDEGDEPWILQERVIEFPTDLESFFESILNRVDSVYHHQTAQALVLAYLYAEGHDDAAACSSYLDFELLGRAHKGLHDPRYLWTLEPQRVDSGHYLALVKRTRKFLSASCKDLLILDLPSGFLEIQACAEDPSSVKVQFLHRTVFEYLRSSGRIQKLQGKVPPCFHDESVFHLLNMGKLKLAWDRQRMDSNPYFEQQASFSLDHSWPGLDSDFVDQVRRCQPLHQSGSYPIASQYSTYNSTQENQKALVETNLPSNARDNRCDENDAFQPFSQTNHSNHPLTSTLTSEDELELKRFATHMQMLDEDKGKKKIRRRRDAGSINRKRAMEEATDHQPTWSGQSGEVACTDGATKVYDGQKRTKRENAHPGSQAYCDYVNFTLDGHPFADQLVRSVPTPATAHWNRPDGVRDDTELRLQERMANDDPWGIGGFFVGM